jgi:hypothetical protein
MAGQQAQSAQHLKPNGAGNAAYAGCTLDVAGHAAYAGH